MLAVMSRASGNQTLLVFVTIFATWLKCNVFNR
jgi:hypothetical protein